MQKIVLNIPHAGTEIPLWAARDMMLPQEELTSLVDFITDKDVDKLWAFVGEENKQVAAVSRIVVDTERYRNDTDEPMAAKGMGLYYTHTPDGKLFRLRKEDSYRRSLALYDAHHAALEEKVAACLAKHGACLLLDCHSFHDRMTHTGYDPATLPDVCIGVNGAVMPEAQRIIQLFRAAGYTVKVNQPFSGSLVPLQYWGDPRVHSVMIELNRRIYDNEDFHKVQKLCQEIYETLCAPACIA